MSSAAIPPAGLTGLRQWATDLQTKCNSVIAELQEPFKSQYTKFRDSINDFLAKLPPLDQVPATQQASYGMDNLAYALLHAQNTIQSMFANLEQVRETCVPKTSLCGLVDAEVTKRGLLTAEQSAELVKAARAEAATEATSRVTAHYALVAERRGKLGGLPSPADEVLGLAEADFTAQVTEANTRKAKLTENKIPADGASAYLLWVPKAQFDQTLGVLIAAKGGTPPVEPALGGGGTGTAAKPKRISI